MQLLYVSLDGFLEDISTCLKPPVLALPPVRSIVRRDVTTPPPRSGPELPLPASRIAVRIALRMLPYVVPCPRSMAWMKQKVMAPVEVIFERAYQKNLPAKISFVCHKESNITFPIINPELTDVSADV